MKKVLLIVNSILLVTILRANPIGPPSIVLSELFFDMNGKWVIELQYFDTDQKEWPIDSIWIKTSSGISRVKRINIIGFTGVFVIDNDSMASNLIINPVKDSIQISYTFGTYKETNIALVYGNSPDYAIRNPINGQSIARIPNNEYLQQKYSIDKSPTIGGVNDTLGMSGTIKGHVYDKNGNLLPNSTGWLNNYQTGLNFYLNLDGAYSSRLYSTKNHLDELYYHSTLTTGEYVNITPIEVTMQPDSVITIDIHILSSLNVEIKDINKASESIIKIFPNPLNGLILNYEISLPVKSSNCTIRLVSLNGQKIAEFHITDNSGMLNLPSNIENGSYMVLLFLNDKNYSSSQVLIAR